MRINKINCTSICRYNDNNKPNQSFRTPIFRSGSEFNILAQKTLTEKFKDFSIQEYKRLSVKEINLVNEYVNRIYSTAFDSLLKYHDLAAECLRSNLDSAYGKNKYVVIPIGRSLSSIGKCLGYKIGEENVKNLPMSTASRFLDIEKRHENYSEFKKYLDSVGLSQKEIETSGKTYIFTDFCHSGASMLGVERLFNDRIWGKHDNVKFVNISDLLTNRDSEKINDYIFINNLNDMLYGCDFKLYSFVKPCSNLAVTKFSLVNTTESPNSVKSFWYKLLDYEVKKNSSY